ncbi:MAG: hypothetical protein MJ252_24540, partial [archaeon]|nr:hypothetical protein [archaeon]
MNEIDDPNQTLKEKLKPKIEKDIIRYCFQNKGCFPFVSTIDVIGILFVFILAYIYSNQFNYNLKKSKIFSFFFLREITSLIVLRFKLMDPYLISTLEYISKNIQFYLITRQVGEYMEGQNLFNCDINFNKNFGLLFNALYSFVIFPFEIFKYLDIVALIQYILQILFAFFIYFIYNRNIKEFSKFLNDRDLNKGILFQILQPHLKYFHLYKISSALQKIIFINFFMFVFISALKFMFIFLIYNNILIFFSRYLIITMTESIGYLFFLGFLYIEYLIRNKDTFIVNESGEENKEIEMKKKKKKR